METKIIERKPDMKFATVFIITILAGLAGYLIASNRQAEGLILLAMTLIIATVIVLISEDKKT